MAGSHAWNITCPSRERRTCTNSQNSLLVREREMPLISNNLHKCNKRLNVTSVSIQAREIRSNPRRRPRFPFPGKDRHPAYANLCAILVQPLRLLHQCSYVSVSQGKQRRNYVLPIANQVPFYTGISLKWRMVCLGSAPVVGSNHAADESNDVTLLIASGYSRQVQYDSSYRCLHLLRLGLRQKRCGGLTGSHG